MGFTKSQLVIFAARSGTLALLRERVAAGGKVNYVDPVHGAPLSVAIQAANLSTIAWLIENGADVNAEYRDGVGPLEVALHRPVPEVVGVLLQAGARLRRKTRPYYSARLTKCLKILGGSRDKPGVADGELANNRMQRTRSAKDKRRGPRR